MSVRGNPRAKLREEEQELDQSLSDAGLWEEGMTLEAKKEMFKVLTDSRQTAQMEEIRRQSSVAKDDSDDEDVVEMQTSTPQRQVSSPDIFGESPMVDVSEQAITSPFSSTVEAVRASDSSEDSVEEPAANNSSVGVGAEIFVSDDEDEAREEADDEEDFVIETSDASENIPPQFQAGSEESTSHSFQSANDVLEVETSSSKSRALGNAVPTSAIARFHLKSALKSNVLPGPQEEVVPFYKTYLSERPRVTNKQVPLYFDPALKLSRAEHRRLVDTAVTRDSALHARMLATQRGQEECASGFAPPVRESYDRNIDSLDKTRASQEPEECVILPWGAKPVVLNYTYNPHGSIRSSISKLAARPGLSITKVTRTHSEPSTSSSAASPAFNLPSPMARVHNQAAVSAALFSNQTEAAETKRPRRETASKQADVYDFEVDDDDGGDVSDKGDGAWIEPKAHARGPARGRGRGNAGTSGGADARGRGARAKRGGKKNRKRGEQVERPPLVGVQSSVLLQGVTRSLSRNEISDQLTHPALGSPGQGQCPICQQEFPTHEIEEHAAECIEYPQNQASSQCCPVCNTIVPESLRDKHRAKCGLKRHSTNNQTTAMASGSFIGTGANEYEVEDLISEDEDETLSPPVKRPRPDASNES